MRYMRYMRYMKKFAVIMMLIITLNVTGCYADDALQTMINDTVKNSTSFHTRRQAARFHAIYFSLKATPE